MFLLCGVVEEELHDGFWILQAVRVVTNPRFVDYVYLTSEFLITFFDDVAVFSDWHYFVSVANDVKNRDVGLGQGGESVNGVAIEPKCLVLGKAIG
tara:strand:- start:51 stop:338 length:288 start_codon:yes stop_codon:yes gene_type:complete